MAAYGQCLVANLTNLNKGVCETQFVPLRKCLAEAVSVAV
jgi:hypothetical protein